METLFLDPFTILLIAGFIGFFMAFGIGANAYLSGHNSKLTLEYFNTKYGTNDAVGTLTLQAMIYL